MKQAVFAYIPVVHAGTLTFLNAHKDIPIFLLDNVVGKKENPYLERDIRALNATDIVKELAAHGFSTEVVAPAQLAEKIGNVDVLIVPEDEIIDYFLEKYAPEVPVKKESVFLRWTKQISTTEHEVPPDRTITTDQFVNDICTTLEQEANRSPDWWRQIAAAIVKDGKIVAVAHNKHLPSAHTLTIHGDPRSNLDAGQGPGIYTSIHAEACVLAQAAREGISTNGTDMIMTTFPCPVCARSIVESGVQRVFYRKGYSVLDAEEILKGAGVSIILVKE